MVSRDFRKERPRLLSFSGGCAGAAGGGLKMLWMPMSLNKSFCSPYAISPPSNLLFHSGVFRDFGGDALSDLRAVVPCWITDRFDSADNDRRAKPRLADLSVPFFRSIVPWFPERSVRILLRLVLPSGMLECDCDLLFGISSS